MDELVQAAPRCQFYERVKVEGGYRYDRININGPSGFERFVTPYPPATGDLISLWDAYEKRGGTFRVIERMWLHSGYGSTDWPPGSLVSKKGPLLDIIVEAAEGPFVDEMPRADDEE
ncbi:hypothetical protein [Streptomyces sp. SCL15-4]|uniref:hypothetical protein n=1 Tax=Streptomyces sp. SCL15-4 TaxID=2967221 RepID=UPI0029667716|nr:hypothetical protein [Streptomyces sp. SCL15-4]